MLNWVDTGGRFQLAVTPRPPGGQRLEPTIAWLAAGGVQVMASMLTDDQVVWLDLADQGAVCAAHGIEFLRFPIVDHQVPDDRDAALAFAGQLLHRLEDGKGVMVHCLAGIGRSALIAAAAMGLAGFAVKDACARISQARGRRCPETYEQMAWLEAAFPG